MQALLLGREVLLNGGRPKCPEGKQAHDVAAPRASMALPGRQQCAAAVRNGRGRRGVGGGGGELVVHDALQQGKGGRCNNNNNNSAKLVSNFIKIIQHSPLSLDFESYW